jgi:N-acyl homoserine lactone hydrolase
MSLIITVLLALATTGASQPAPTSLPAGSLPEYRVYPLSNGICTIAGNDAFLNGNKEESYPYRLYVWLVLGGEKPMLVDAGLTDVAEMNRGAAAVLREPIRQLPEESAAAQLRKFGLTPDDIGWVFITHLHFDHVDGLDAFRNAKICVGKKEWRLATSASPSWGDGRIMHELSNNPQWKLRLVLADDEQLLPGLEAFWVGGHTPGSTAYRVHTAAGWAVFTGDTVSLLANIERDVPIGVLSSPDECRAAMRKIRERADVVLPSHDPGTVLRWPPAPKGASKYTIRAVKVGQCNVRDYITFQDSDSQDTSPFNLYVWVIEGGEHPIVVETGPKHPAEFSKATAKYIPGGVVQKPEERTPEALRRCGIDPASVSHVIATHLHGDHYDYFDAFPNARLVVSRCEYESAGGVDADVARAISARPDALQLVADEEIAPGVRIVPLGCHTDGSQGVLVRTWMGPVLLAGDVLYKYANLEQNRPIRSPDPSVCRAAMDRIRSLADIVLPAHDPLTLERWPGGIIGDVPGRQQGR